MKTARKMGIKTVAVYSDADRNAVHVREADEAIYIGPSQSKLSYLNIDNIVKACKETGAEAVHPGYGFLSENAKFEERLVAEVRNGFNYYKLCMLLITTPLSRIEYQICWP